MLRVVEESQPVWQISCNFNCTQTGKNRRHLLRLNEQSKVDNVFNTLRLGVWAASEPKELLAGQLQEQLKAELSNLTSPCLSLWHSLFSYWRSIWVWFLHRWRCEDSWVTFGLPGNNSKNLCDQNLRPVVPSWHCSELWSFTCPMPLSKSKQRFIFIYVASPLICPQLLELFTYELIPNSPF